MGCEQEELTYQRSLQEYTAAKDALQQVDARIDAVGREAMSGLISTWKCVLGSKGNPLQLAQCVVDMPTEREVTEKLRRLAKEAKTAQDRLEVSVTTLKAATQARGDCLHQPPPPPPPPVPPTKPRKVPPRSSCAFGVEPLRTSTPTRSKAIAWSVAARRRRSP